MASTLTSSFTLAKFTGLVVTFGGFIGFYYFLSKKSKLSNDGSIFLSALIINFIITLLIRPIFVSDPKEAKMDLLCDIFFFVGLFAFRFFAMVAGIRMALRDNLCQTVQSFL